MAALRVICVVMYVVVDDDLVVVVRRSIRSKYVHARCMAKRRTGRTEESDCRHGLKSRTQRSSRVASVGSKELLCRPVGSLSMTLLTNRFGYESMRFGELHQAEVSQFCFCARLDLPNDYHCPPRRYKRRRQWQWDPSCCFGLRRTPHHRLCRSTAVVD